MCALVYRREPFGAVVADCEGDNVVLLGKQAARAFELLAQGVTDREIVEQLEGTGTPSQKLATELSELRALSNGSGVSESNRVDRLQKFPPLSFPLDLHWELTRRCNERCAHCYNDSGPHRGGPSEAQIDSVLDELDGVDLRTITVSGGEPLLLPNIWSVSERLRAKAYRLVLATNGTLINEEAADRIASVYDVVNLSLDSADPVEFDRFRGLRGAFQKTVQAIRLLKQRAVPVVVQTVIIRNGAFQLDDLGELLLTLQVDGWNVRLPFGCGRAGRNLLFPFDAARRVERALEAVRTRFVGRIPGVAMGSKYTWSAKYAFRTKKWPDRLLTCCAGTVMAALCADGRLAPCPLFAGTNFRSDPIWGSSLANAWGTARCFNALREVRLKQIPICSQCSQLAKCGSTAGCRALAYMRCGSIYAPDEDCGYGRLHSGREDAHCEPLQGSEPGFWTTIG